MTLPGDTPTKPPVLRTVARSWGFLWQHRLPLVVVVVPTITLLLALLSLPFGLGPKLIAPPLAYVGVAWLWFMCVSPRVTTPAGLWPRSRPFVFWNATPSGRFLSLGVLLIAAYIICVSVPTQFIDQALQEGELQRGQRRPVVLHATIVATAHMIFFFAFTLVIARILLILPATNNCERWSLRETWQRTSGVTWRLWLTISLLNFTASVVPGFAVRTIAVVMHTFGATLPATSFAIASMIESVLAVMLSVGALELFFRSWIVAEPPAQRQAATPEAR